jgi:hypothetical protein
VLAMRWSWLSSPAVGLLTFLAALITVGQWLVALVRVPITLARTIIASPYPLSIQLAISMELFGGWLICRFAPDPAKRPRLFYAFGVPLTTWLRHPGAGLDSYRRHLQTWREFEAMGPPHPFGGR